MHPDATRRSLWKQQLSNDRRTSRVSSRPANRPNPITSETQGSNESLAQGSLCAGDRPADAELLAASGFDVYRYEHRGVQKHHHRLLLPVRSVVGRFKVLIFPYRESTDLPQTTLSADGSRLTVRIGTASDLFRFTTGEDGRTRVVLQRDGSVVAEVK